MRTPLVFLLVLAAFLAGCLGGGNDEGGTFQDGITDDDTNDGAGGDGNATDDATVDELDPFEPQTHTWDGVIPIHACINAGGGGTCAHSPVPERDDSNSFEVAEGATLASFEFTWDTGSPELIVHVGGKPTVEEGENRGTSPLQFEVPLDDSGPLAVSVYTDTSGIGFTGYDTEFHMALIVS